MAFILYFKAVKIFLRFTINIYLYFDILSVWKLEFNSNYTSYLIVKEDFNRISYRTELQLAHHLFFTKPGFLFVAMSKLPFLRRVKLVLTRILY